MENKIYDEAFKLIFPMLKKSLDEKFDSKDETANDKKAMNEEIKEYIKDEKNAKVLIDRVTEGYINQLNNIKAPVTIDNIKKLIKPEALCATTRIIYGAAKMEILMAQIKELQAKKD